MNIHERGYPPKRSERNADPCGAGSVHDPERRAVYTHVPNYSIIYIGTSLRVYNYKRLLRSGAWTYAGHTRSSGTGYTTVG